ncbi:MAG: hypothetical protein KME26_15890 [Oscillatoria princeps RMCB-10]|nr:hypothetical protein [Oscillatoria princeps RMCB-10]
MGFSPTANFWALAQLQTAHRLTPEFSAQMYLLRYTYQASRFVSETDTATGSRFGDSRFQPNERQLAEGSSWGEVEGTR